MAGRNPLFLETKEEKIESKTPQPEVKFETLPRAVREFITLSALSREELSELSQLENPHSISGVLTRTQSPDVKEYWKNLFTHQLGLTEQQVKLVIERTKNYPALYETLQRLRLTPLHRLLDWELICLSGDVEAIEQADIITRECEGFLGNPLHYATLSGSPEAMQAIVTKCALSPDDIKSINKQGDNIANLAALSGSIPALKLAIEQYKMDLNASSYGLNSPYRDALHAAAESGSPQMMHYLIDERKMLIWYCNYDQGCGYLDGYGGYDAYGRYDNYGYRRPERYLHQYPSFVRCHGVSIGKISFYRCSLLSYAIRSGNPAAIEYVLDYTQLENVEILYGTKSKYVLDYTPKPRDLYETDIRETVISEGSLPAFLYFVDKSKPFPLDLANTCLNLVCQYISHYKSRAAQAIGAIALGLPAQEEKAFYEQRIQGLFSILNYLRMTLWNQNREEYEASMERIRATFTESKESLDTPITHIFESAEFKKSVTPQEFKSVGPSTPFLNALRLEKTNERALTRTKALILAATSLLFILAPFPFMPISITIIASIFIGLAILKLLSTDLPLHSKFKAERKAGMYSPMSIFPLPKNTKSKDQHLAPATSPAPVRV